MATTFPPNYVPNCVANDGLLLTREDHLEVQLHVQSRAGVARATKYVTPGVSGRWGWGVFAKDFIGMGRTAPISLGDFKNWVAREVPRMLPGFWLTPPGVCVKTIWRRDGTRIVAPPYEVPPAAEPETPAPDSGGSDVPLTLIDPGAALAEARRRAAMTALARLRGGGGFTPGRVPTGTWTLPGGGRLPPDTTTDGGEVATPPDTAPVDESGVSWWTQHQDHVRTGVMAVAVLAAVFAGYKAWKGSKGKKSNRRRRNTGRRAYASKEGMMKGYWKVVLTDGTVVVSGLGSKRYAVELADEINQQGFFYTGISGFRREEPL